MLPRSYIQAGRGSLLTRYADTMGELALRHQTELAMATAKAESDLANRAKSSFLGTMSHELRTPLNAIIGFSDLIGNADPDTPAATQTAEYAEQISKAGRHMLSIISDVLDMAKLESGTFQLNLDMHDIGEVIEDSVPMVRQRIKDKNQTLEVRLEKNLAELPMDARRIRQVLINLLSNAHKFTPEGGRILVTARPTRDGGVTVAVVDTGIGMTPDQMAVAIQPFGQVQSHYTRTSEGSGLGLAIARGLAHQHGGDLYIEGEPDVGTAVVLTLPARSNAGPHASTAGAGGGERAKPRRATVPKKEKSA
ncbi:MAG: HAMP domain-containing histidine kinase [Alphaproteobacteria bacterium]|nr:HAMP domain-containing histidine kinase [Alphaproteobacteria bacterium]